MYCSELQSIVIPPGVTSIEGYAFYGCSGIRSLVIPKGVTRIPMRIFYGCSGLESIIIPQEVTAIEFGAFYGCSRLQSIIIPEGVTSIGAGAFNGCSELQRITIPKGVSSIGNQAFMDCCRLQSITIPEQVTSINYEAFYCCSRLETITIPKGITAIDKSAFNECPSLQSIVIDSQSEAIKERITALLPKSLKTKLILNELAEEVFKFRDAELSRLMQIPEISPLFRFFHMKSPHRSRVQGENGVERECSKLPDELLQTINCFSDDNRYYKKARRRILGLPLPANPEKLLDYKNKVTTIVNECVSKAKEFTQYINATQEQGSRRRTEEGRTKVALSR
ncbi:leucine-rich repeat domain-containing protein [Legionella sp. PATHC035]|uniref:leucine-rich repeat domain-containing protein n=1 Tax=Legionella sp. PATHC035 TaxID=2992040 RepID=UPI002242E38A|nr:leucine-rich repeat domain-containing protein [Legionella sp. PATHC035]MCW8410483.1 leucine-rich repeat domain-containing protein [Legionella sp. PATHC035]